MFKNILLVIVKGFNYVLMFYYISFLVIHCLVLIFYILIAVYFWVWNGLQWMGMVNKPTEKLKDEEIEKLFTESCHDGQDNDSLRINHGL